VHPAVTFNVCGDERGTEEAMPFDIVPYASTIVGDHLDGSHVDLRLCCLLQSTSPTWQCEAGPITAGTAAVPLELRGA
jgi:hypothetical protein